ncbi:MAG: DNRLRE domain-containing protein [Pirellulaceae bacterium]|nr:DNRLRE domain-containing protein [Pirellulaceae bacterium]
MRSFFAFLSAFAFLSVIVPLDGMCAMMTLLSVQDNTIFSENGGLSNGAGEYLFSGRTNSGGPVRRGLIKFDIAGQIPAGSVITSATLGLKLVNPRITNTATINTHRVTSNWGQGTSKALGEEGGGIAATPGDATWTESLFGSTNWGAIGGDFVPGVSASQSVSTNALYQWSSPGLTADVQSFLDNGGSNFGWILIGNESVNLTAKRFGSSENLVAGDRPFLKVEFTAVPEPSSAFLLGCSAIPIFLRRRRNRV